MYGSMTLYLILPVTPSILDILVPLNETRPKKALYEAEYGVDPDDYFIEILIHSYVTTIVTIAILVTVDTMYFVNVQHACALFKIVGTNLKLSLEGKESNENKNFKTICYCINLHKNALRSVDSHISRDAFSCSILRRRSTFVVLNCSFADLLESNYSMPFAGIIFFYLVVMSLTAVLMVIKFGETEDMLRFACLTVAQVFSLYLNTLPGQNLMDHSLHIHSIAYEFQWYEMSTENQKLILLIMLKSRKPSVLTAGKIYVISMESYSSVMQSAISYFTVFSSMRQ